MPAAHLRTCRWAERHHQLQSLTAGRNRNTPLLPPGNLLLQVYNASGYPDFINRVEKYGQHFGRTTHWLSWQTSPRCLRAAARAGRWGCGPAVLAPCEACCSID